MGLRKTKIPIRAATIGVNIVRPPRTQLCRQIKYPPKTTMVSHFNLFQSIENADKGKLTTAVQNTKFQTKLITINPIRTLFHGNSRNNIGNTGCAIKAGSIFHSTALAQQYLS